MFFAGPELEPTNVRIRTLEEGRLPIVHYEFEPATAWSIASLSLPPRWMRNPEAKLVNFIRVTMKNQGSQPTRAILATGIRYDAPGNTGAPYNNNRFSRPIYPSGDYQRLCTSPSARIGYTPLTETAFFAMAACFTPFLPVTPHAASV